MLRIGSTQQPSNTMLVGNQLVVIPRGVLPRETSRSSVATSISPSRIETISDNSIPTNSLSSIFSQIPQPLHELSIETHWDRQVRDCVRINGRNYTYEQITKAWQHAKLVLDTQVVNLTTRDSTGCNAIHLAAIHNNFALIDYLANPLKSTNLQVDVDAYNIERRANALSYAITNSHFDLARMLITHLHANVYNLVRLSSASINENTCGLLRLVLFRCLPPNHIPFALRSSLTNLVQLLINKGLKFFETKGSSCPASFEFGRFIKKYTKQDEEIMARYNLSVKQYAKLSSVYSLKQLYPTVFELFWNELLLVKDDLTHRNNADAQDIWTIWNHRVHANGHDDVAPRYSR